MTTVQRIIKYLAMAFAIFLSVSIIGGIFTGIASLSFLFSDGDSVGEMKEYGIEKQISDLKIDISAASLVIKNGDEFKVESNHKYITCKEKGGSLEITEKKNGILARANHRKVIVTIPENTSFDSVEIDAGAGEVKIQELAANTLKINLGAGEFQADKLVASQKTRIDGGVGSVTIRNGLLQNAEIEMGVGELDLTGALKGTGSIDYGIGETNLTLIGDPSDYRVELDKGVGEAKIEGNHLSDGSIYGNGSNHLEIDGGIGELNIEFQPVFE